MNPAMAAAILSSPFLASTHLGFIPGTFSALEAAVLLLKASLSILFPLLDGAESEMVYPRGRCPEGERGEVTGPVPSNPPDPVTLASSPLPSQLPSPSPSRFPDWDFDFTSVLSLLVTSLPFASLRTSCSVCSSGEELDLLSGWDGWKESSSSVRPSSDGRTLPMGIPPSTRSSDFRDFSSWLEVEEDLKKEKQKWTVFLISKIKADNSNARGAPWHFQWKMSRKVPRTKQCRSRILNKTDIYCCCSACSPSQAIQTLNHDRMCMLVSLTSSFRGCQEGLIWTQTILPCV